MKIVKVKESWSNNYSDSRTFIYSKATAKYRDSGKRNKYMTTEISFFSKFRFSKAFIIDCLCNYEY